MELKKYTQIILRWWWLVIASLVSVTAASFAFSSSRPPRYQSSSTLIVSPKVTIDEISIIRQSLDTLDTPTIINTYAEVIRSRQIYNLAQDSLDLPAESRGTVDIMATALQRTNLITIEAQGVNPKLVHNMADAVATQAITYINDLYALYDIKILDSPEFPLLPYSPNVLRDTALGGALGLMLGVSAAFLVHYLRMPNETPQPAQIIDPEDGLYTLKFFIQMLREEISRAKRNKHFLTVAIISLEHPDNTNPALTKRTKQANYRQVVDFLKRQMRQGEILAHWSGNRLVWLLLDANQQASAQAINRVRTKLERASFTDKESGEKFRFTAQFGAVSYSEDMSDTVLMSLAEQAHQKAKQNGASGLLVKESDGQVPESAGSTD